MLQFTAITPHSPLLLKHLQATKKRKYPSTEQAFKKIAEEIKAKQIHNIITIGAHPAFDRGSFSVYTHPRYNIQFQAFGDLVTSEKIPIWWSAYYKLREASQVEIIDDENIDYSHGIPLLKLQKLLGEDYQLSILAINDHESATTEERQKFGKLLYDLDFEEPHAIIATGDLSVTDKEQEISGVYRENRLFVEALKKNPKQLPESIPGAKADVLPPCLTGPLEILIGSLPEDFKYEEISYEQAEQTNFLVASYSQKES